ncbi:MAG: SagB/ThcOx family dehydrogenase [Spirochaetes bacterium]|nr:SagB/ThcOx family dehydrogenase [Spirochaetota bacterium]
MTLKELLDTWPQEKRAYVVAERSWACDDPVLSRAFAKELALSGREAAAGILATLVGAARNRLEEAMEGQYGTVSAVSGDMKALVEKTASEFDGVLGRSAAIKLKAKAQRSILKANFGDLAGCVTDQKMGIPFPGIKATPDGATIERLPAPDRSVVRVDSIHDVIARRKSVRSWGEGSISKAELSWLLWATQGIRGGTSGHPTLRNVPSGGSRHPFETWLVVRNVEGIAPGIWRYRPVEHDLVLVRPDADLETALTKAAREQDFVGSAPLTFIWTVIPYRTEWRYCTAAHKIILQDSGHLGQNLYLAATAIGCGTCGIGAYDQGLMDAIVGVDGEDEFVIYCAPVGRLKG